MKSDMPFLVMLTVLVLTSLAFLLAATPPAFPMQRWDDEIGLQKKIDQMQALNRESSTPFEYLGSAGDGAR